jgi:hypothetical protein
VRANPTENGLGVEGWMPGSSLFLLILVSYMASSLLSNLRKSTLPVVGKADLAGVAERCPPAGRLLLASNAES